MRRVGFIGVGDMGMGMARNILRKGHELTVYDIRKEPLEELAQAGAQIAKSLKEIGQGSDVVFIMVLNGPQVKEIVLGQCMTTYDRRVRDVQNRCNYGWS